MRDKYASRRKVTPRQWLDVDWDKPDLILAKELGVSRERVRQKRVEMGRPTPYHRNISLYRFAPLVALAEGVNRSSVARVLGVSNLVVRRLEKKVGATLPRGRKPFIHPWHTVDWENRSNVEILGDLGFPKTPARQVQVSRARRRFAPKTIGKFLGGRARPEVMERHRNE